MVISLGQWADRPKSRIRTSTVTGTQTHQQKRLRHSDVMDMNAGNNKGIQIFVEKLLGKYQTIHLDITKNGFTGRRIRAELGHGSAISALDNYFVSFRMCPS